MSKKIELGDIAKDSITGLQGTVMCTSEYLYGCKRHTIQPHELKDGKPVDWVSFDEEQLVLVSKKSTKHVPVKTGGPRPEPRRQ